MFVKPAKGLKVRDPASKRHIPETGIEVPDTDTFWMRRLMDGDVIHATPPIIELPAELPAAPASPAKE
jgi:hypothetical protein